MLGHGAAALGGKPGQCAARIGHGFERAEGFRRDDEQRAVGLALRQHFEQLLRINIGDKVDAFAAVVKGRERVHRHARS